MYVYICCKSKLFMLCDFKRDKNNWRRKQKSMYVEHL